MEDDSLMTRYDNIKFLIEYYSTALLDIRNKAEARRYREQQKAKGEDVEIHDGQIDWLYGNKEKPEVIPVDETLTKEIQVTIVKLGENLSSLFKHVFNTLIFVYCNITYMCELAYSVIIFLGASGSNNLFFTKH